MSSLGKKVAKAFRGQGKTRGTEKLNAEGLTPGEHKAAEMARNDYGNPEIAEEQLAPPNSISTLLSRARAKGVDVPYARRGRKPVEKSRMKKLFEMGRSDAEIIEITGKKPNAIYQARFRWKRSRGEE